MKTVISASRRTDIPAFYLDWFIDKIHQGYIDTTNPFNPRQKRRVSLLPHDVEWIIFWSRNYQPFINKKDYFKDYNLFFHFTILPQSDFEKSAVPLSSAVKQLSTLAKLYGPDRIIWRYDPLIYWRRNERIETNHSDNKFENLCMQISKSGINRCYLSFVHPYKKFTDRMHHKFPARRIINLEQDKKIEVLQNMHQIAEKYNIRLYSCSNDDLLKFPFIKKGHCIDGFLLNRLSGSKIVSEAKSPSRSGCGCTKSIDIGSYVQHPCHFGCIYCYANPVWR